MCASTVAHASTLTENFSTLDHFDAAATAATGSAGVWNINTGQSGNPGPCAMVPVVDNDNQAPLNGAASKMIDFGNGSDGAVDSSSGYTFDTNAHPNGYNFTSVNITGGTITVTGTNPLIIHSLTTVNITPNINLSGGNGAASANGGAAGGAPPTSQASGGAGGTTAGGTGGTGLIADGTAGGGAGGAGCASGTCTRGGQSAAGVGGDFDATGGFTAGGAGGGGGGNSGSAAAGGGGGAGGGALQITALGTMTIAGTLSANGGNGGSNGTAGAACSSGTCPGSGTGGNAGSIWLQSFNGITMSGSASASVGSAGLGNGVAGGGFSNVRGDEPGTVGSPPAWTTGGAGSGGAYGGSVPTLTTTGTYYVVSSAYDLQTNNASFSSPSITESGGATVQYSGSKDGASFSTWTSDITSLSNKDYRYIKFEITLPGSSYVNSISIPYDGPSLDTADLSLSAGCGGLEAIRSKDGSPGNDRSDKTGLMMTCFWALLYLLAWQAFKRTMRSEARPY